MARTIHIEDAHLAILRSAVIEGNSLRLTGTLDRATYTTINKVLEALEGKWNRAAKAHLFPGPIMDQIKAMLDGGTVAVEKKATEQQTLQAFYTPDAVAEQFAELVERLEGSLSGKTILEPSCGDGALVRPLMKRGADVFGVDVNQVALDKCGTRKVWCCDFMSFTPAGRYDLCVMNPPFNKGQDAKHVLHALQCVRPRQHVYSILPPMWREKATGPYKALNEVPSAVLLELDAGTFEDTKVRTEIVQFTNS